LLRASTLWGTWQYSVGDIHNHHLLRQSHALQHIDIRRLCYVLDYKAGKPTKVTWERECGILTLKSELPGYERKFLSAIGTLQATEGRYYPRRWVGIDPKHTNSVKEHLTRLGIQIDII